MHPSSPFPALPVFNQSQESVDISQRDGDRWKMIIVYRGKHCPLCTKFLNNLEAYQARLDAINIDMVAVSGDSLAQLTEHQEKLNVSFELFYGLTVEQMKTLGCFISHPRSEKETDHPFAEPGLFIINSQGTLQVVDVSNNPFVRPDLEALVSGLEYILEHDYPIRGTYQ